MPNSAINLVRVLKVSFILGKLPIFISPTTFISLGLLFGRENITFSFKSLIDFLVFNTAFEINLLLSSVNGSPVNKIGVLPNILSKNSPKISKFLDIFTYFLNISVFVSILSSSSASVTTAASASVTTVSTTVSVFC